MQLKTFAGGIHPEYSKSLTKDKTVVPAALPGMAVIPLSQHIGAPCEPLVKVGDEVKTGQKIGDSEGFVSAPVHASISGKVVKIDDCNHPLGRPVKAIYIESDGNDTWHEDTGTVHDYNALEADDLKNIIREAGIVGMGGATFPTHVKLSPPPEHKIEYVLVNGAECEPYLTADHRVMLEKTKELVEGLKIVMKVVGAEKGFIGIEDNKLDAVEALREATASDEKIEVHVLHTKYPQGAEKQLIKVLTGREVPSGGLPMAVGCVVQNAGTCVAIAEAVSQGRPLLERIVTVTGEGVNEPANLRVRVGTIITEVLNQCGGLTADVKKLISGGPMMGLAQPGSDLPVTKGTSGVLCLTEDEVKIEEISPCIKCAKCVEACPVSIMPIFIGSAVEQNLFEKAEAYHAMDCIECGCCSYVCPAKRPLVQWIRMGKADITARRRK